MTCVRCVVILFSLAAGCQSTQVEKRVTTLVGTVPDLYQDQVLQNLAVLASDSSAVPFFAVPQSGTNTNTRQLQAGYTPGWDLITGASQFVGRYVFDKQTAAISGQISNAQAFQLQPVYDPDKLLLMQIAYRKALGDPTLAEAQLKTLEGFFSTAHRSAVFDYYRAITGVSLSCKAPTEPEASCCYPDITCGPRDPNPCRAAWLGVSNRKCDTKGARYVGQYDHSYVWVSDERSGAFRHFTLAILDIATAAPQVKQGRYAPQDQTDRGPYIQQRIFTSPYPAPVGM